MIIIHIFLINEFVIMNILLYIYVYKIYFTEIVNYKTFL